MENYRITTEDQQKTIAELGDIYRITTAELEINYI